MPAFIQHLIGIFEKNGKSKGNDASKLIFTLSQWGRQYLPDDSFAEVVNDICKSDKVSIMAVRLARDIYYKEKKLWEFVDEVKSAGFEITQELNASFPAELLEQEWCEWMCGGRERYINDILIVPFYRFQEPLAMPKSHSKWECGK